MGNIIVSEFITLDGVIENPEWSMPFFNEEIGKFKKDDLFASDALFIGRVTYEIHAAAWPSEKDEEGLADRMNSTPKYVVSSTLKQVEWNNSRLIRRNILEEIKKLKREIKRNILIDGGSDANDLQGRTRRLVKHRRLCLYNTYTLGIAREGINRTFWLLFDAKG